MYNTFKIQILLPSNNNKKKHLNMCLPLSNSRIHTYMYTVHTYVSNFNIETIALITIIRLSTRASMYQHKQQLVCNHIYVCDVFIYEIVQKIMSLTLNKRIAQCSVTRVLSETIARICKQKTNLYFFSNVSRAICG